VRALAELSGDELADVALAWCARAHAARKAGFRYVHAFVNEGRAAGASLPHTHSQLLWLPEPPPAVTRELRGGGCPVCESLSRERSDGTRVVAARGGLVLLCPWASRAPYELLCAPDACRPDPFDDPGALARALALLADGARRLRAVAGGEVPLNAWLHTGVGGAERGHWHLELVPRLTIAAGLELGAELHVNPLPPEDAAAALRGA
jgi:UDPglucose--hexose-1-phosphate uridylyltransferase